MRVSPNNGEVCNSSRAPQLTPALKCQVRDLTVCGKRHNYRPSFEENTVLLSQTCLCHTVMPVMHYKVTRYSNLTTFFQYRVI